MIQLEDNFDDIIGKTLRGTGMADGILSFLTGVETDVIEKLKGGDFDEAAVRAIAPSLGLDGNTLVERANGSWRPEVVELEGLKQFNTLFDDDPEDPMTVNSYLVWDPQTKEAALFDTGANAADSLAAVSELGLDLKFLFSLTRTSITL